ncbi:MAG: AAA family ATPase [Chloroflexi bacterium]|nr:AAA family ATPase [Chloroflexota bacterium]
MAKSYIQKMKLVNWRSFQNETLELKPGLNTFVGSNNAGKSTLLEALNMAMGDVFLNRYNPPTTDFHLANTTSFEIYVALSIPSSVIASTNQRFQRFFGKDDQTVAGNIIGSIRLQGTKDHGVRTEFYDNDRWEEFSTYYLQQCIDFVYVRSTRDISRHTATSYRSPFAELRRLLDKRLAPDVLKLAGDKIKEADAALACDPAFLELQGIIEEVVRDQTDLQKVRFSLVHPTPSELLRNLTLVGLDSFESTMEAKGSGTQNAVILALFQALARLTDKETIFAIEEPETGYHPHGQRVLMERLEQLTGSSGQVLITTHSPNLVSGFSLPQLKRIVKDGGASKSYPMPNRPDLIKALDKHLSENATEMLFASRVLIVEGESEVGYYPEVSRKLNLDLDRQNVSVVNAGGIGQIPKLAKICKDLFIPYYFVADKDRDVKGQLFDGLRKEGIINDETLALIPKHISSEWVQQNFNLLREMHCFLTTERAFEGTVLDRQEVYYDILEALNRVRTAWGEAPLNRDVLDRRQPNDQKDFLLNELKGKKGKKMGFELAQVYTSPLMVPSLVNEIIKAVTAQQ